MTQEPSGPVVIDRDKADLVAPGFALLISEETCWKCGAASPVSAIWLPSFTEIDHEEDEHEASSDAAILHYVGALSAEVWEQWKPIAPWIRYAHTEGSGSAYFANHCITCDTLQGDWFVFGVDGPFFPQSIAEIENIRFIRGLGEFHGCASPSVSSWMHKLEKESR